MTDVHFKPKNEKAENAKNMNIPPSYARLWRKKYSILSKKYIDDFLKIAIYKVTLASDFFSWEREMQLATAWLYIAWMPASLAAQFYGHFYL